MRFKVERPVMVGLSSSLGLLLRRPVAILGCASLVLALGVVPASAQTLVAAGLQSLTTTSSTTGFGAATELPGSPGGWGTLLAVSCVGACPQQGAHHGGIPW